MSPDFLCISLFFNPYFFHKKGQYLKLRPASWLKMCHFTWIFNIYKMLNFTKNVTYDLIALIWRYYVYPLRGNFDFQNVHELCCILSLMRLVDFHFHSFIYYSFDNMIRMWVGMVYKFLLRLIGSVTFGATFKSVMNFDSDYHNFWNIERWIVWKLIF